PIQTRWIPLAYGGSIFNSPDPKHRSVSTDWLTEAFRWNSAPTSPIRARGRFWTCRPTDLSSRLSEGTSPSRMGLEPVLPSITGCGFTNPESSFSLSGGVAEDRADVAGP